MQANRQTHHFVCRASLDMAPAPHNKLHEIFSEFFNMCSFPFCTCRSAKKKVWGKEGGVEGVNEGKGRASSRKERMSEPETDWEMQKAREREGERKPSWFYSKLLPLATALAQPVSYWPDDSMHHNPMHGSSANQGFPCNSAFWISFSPWQHKPALGPGCGLCKVVYTCKQLHVHTCEHTDDCTMLTSPGSLTPKWLVWSERARVINKTCMADRLMQTPKCAMFYSGLRKGMDQCLLTLIMKRSSTLSDGLFLYVSLALQMKVLCHIRSQSSEGAPKNDKNNNLHLFCWWWYCKENSRMRLSLRAPQRKVLFC